LICSPVTTDQNLLAVGLGEIQVSKDANIVLACLGLGSCIGVSAYDPVVKVGAIVHVVLPEGRGEDCEKWPCKFANSALPYMIKQMERLGVIKNRMVIKIVGGAKIIKNVPENSLLDIGSRNVTAIINAISENNLSVKAEDLRGNSGRSMWLYIDSGITRVRTIANPVIEL
jgi:chemotaxis protein CheD